MFDCRFNRFNGLLSLYLGCLIFCTIFQCTIVGLFVDFDSAVGKVALLKEYRLEFDTRLKADTFAGILDVSYDQTPAWNFSTLEHFSYVRCNYSTKNAPINSVIVWDKIHLSNPIVKSSREGKRFKYWFRHFEGRELRNAKITFELCYQYLPHAGPYRTLCHEIIPEGRDYALPAEYIKN